MSGRHGTSDPTGLGRMITEGVLRQIEEGISRELGGGMKKPEGTVTILFTDVEGSSDLVHQLGDEAARTILRRHDDLLRSVFARHAGTEVEHAGDSFMVAFSTARRALACAVDLQEEVAELSRHHPEEAIRIRIGIDTGEVIAEEKGYFGKTVFRAARIAARAEGGQILVSEATRILSGADGSTFRDLGEHELKGLGGAHRLFEVAHTAALPGREQGPLPSP
jgi:class 3 adenylate cyclase